MPRKQSVEDKNLSIKIDKSTDKLCETLANLTDIPKDKLVHLLWIISVLKIHELAMMSMDSDESMKNKEFEYVIPCVGTLTLKCDGNDVTCEKVTLLDNYFKHDVKNAILKGKDPLTGIIKNRFVQTIRNRYKKLL